MKDIFKNTGVLLSKNMMNELFTYPYGFTQEQINRYKEKKKETKDTTIPRDVYIKNEDTPSTITKDGENLSSPLSISSPDSTGSGNSGGGGRVQDYKPKQNTAEKQFDLDTKKAIQRSLEDSQETDFYTANEMSLSLLDEPSSSYYRGRELEHERMIRELNDLKKRQREEMSSTEASALNNKITKLDSDIRLLQKSLHSPNSEPSPPSWLVQPGVEYNSENHDQMYIITAEIEKYNELLKTKLDDYTRQLYLTYRESLEETRREILDRQLTQIRNERTGGKKTKKLRNTKKKRRNKRKKSRKNKK